MAKKVLGDFRLPDEGDIIDQVTGQQEVQQLKANADFLGLLTGWGFEVHKKGREYAIRCPFHGDKTPSCFINPVKNVFHCYGCKKEGDIIHFVRAYRNINFPETLEILRQNPRGRPAVKHAATATGKAPEPAATAPKQTPAPPAGKSLVQLVEAAAAAEEPAISLDTVSDYYHRKLLKSRRAQESLKGRGFIDCKLFARFRIGYCDGSLKGKASAAQQKDLQALGVLRENGREHFKGYLTIPLPGADGRAANIYGRSLNGETPVPHLYLPGENTGIFNYKASRVYDEIILTESVLDALSLLAAGLQNVQALYGTGGLTSTHLAQLKADRVKLVVLALDNDQAGRRAAAEKAATLVSSGFNVKQIFPEGKDWNDDLKACGADAGRLGESVAARLKEAELQAPPPREETLQASKQGQKYIFETGGVTYRLLGVKPGFVASLRVNIRVTRDGRRCVDNADLNSARSRSIFAQSMNRILDLPEQRIENDLLAILDWLEAERDRELGDDNPEERELTEEEKKLGMELLTSAELMKRIVDDLSVLGYVGEDLNKQLIYLAASSRKMADPISVMILSQSASGKSLLVETVRKLIPPEDVVAVSSLSDQALNYMSEGGLLHKFLILGEAVHSDVVELQIREMLSNHELSRMVTCKNEKTGKMETGIIKTKVIVSAMLSSTRPDVNPENASRCFLINTDESSRQTRNIHRAQKRKYSLDRYCEKTNDVPAIIAQHHAAQRLLKPRVIFNPLAEYLDFPDSLMRTRRDNERFIDLIAAVCFLRQYQKKEKKFADPVTGKPVAYIECDLEDYRIAYEIMIKSVLGATYSELPRSMIDFYGKLREVFRKKGEASGLAPCEVQLTQREIRKEVAELGPETIKYYLRKLASLEYLLVGRRGRGSRNSYRLVADEAVERLDCSMIPTPDEIRGKVGKFGKK